MARATRRSFVGMKPPRDDNIRRGAFWTVEGVPCYMSSEAGVLEPVEFLVPPAEAGSSFLGASYPALRAKGGRCVLGYLVAVPWGGTRFCGLRSVMALKPGFSSTCESDAMLRIGSARGGGPGRRLRNSYCDSGVVGLKADSGNEINGVDADLKVSSTRTNAGRDG